MQTLKLYARGAGNAWHVALYTLKPDTLVFLGDEVLTYATPPKTGVENGTLRIVFGTVQEYYTVRRDLNTQGDTGTTWRNVMQKLGW